MQNRSEQLLKNASIFLIGNIGSKIIQFFLVPLYTYTLTTSQYGITEFVLTLSNILMPVFSISILDGLLRFGLDKNRDKRAVLSATLAIAVSGSVASIIVSPFLGRIDSLKGYVCFFLLIMNIQIYSNLFAINLKINDKNKLYALNSVIYTFVLGISSFALLVVFKTGVKGYFCSYIIANIGSILFLTVVGSVFPTISNATLDLQLIKELTKFSIPMIFNAISWWVITASDKIAIQYFMTSSDLGLYGVATKIPSIIITVVGVFIQAWVIAATLEYDSDRNKKFYSEIFEKFYGLIFLLIIGFIAIIKPFMQLYVSQEYRIAWYYAVLLIASAAFSGISSFYDGIYQAAKRTVYGMLTISAGGILNIVLNMFLIPCWGIEGAVIATYFSWAVVALLRMIVSKKFFNFDVKYSKLSSYVVIALTESVCVMCFNGVVGYAVSTIALIYIVISERNLLSTIFNAFNKLIYNFFK